MFFVRVIGVLCYKLRVARCIVVLLGHKNDTVLALDNKINIIIADEKCPAHYLRR